MARDSIHVSKGQACACVICRQHWGNWLQNSVSLQRQWVELHLNLDFIVIY